MVLHVLSPETYLGHFYFLWFFLFSLHPVADQTGAAPITCQRNVPALPSITSSTRAGRAVARSMGPRRAPGAASTLPGELAGIRVRVRLRLLCVCRSTHGFACLRGIDAASGSITWPNMSCPAQRPMWCLWLRQGVPACSPPTWEKEGDLACVNRHTCNLGDVPCRQLVIFSWLWWPDADDRACKSRLLSRTEVA